MKRTYFPRPSVKEMQRQEIIAMRKLARKLEAEREELNRQKIAEEALNAAVENAMNPENI